MIFGSVDFWKLLDYEGELMDNSALSKGTTREVACFLPAMRESTTQSPQLATRRLSSEPDHAGTLIRLPVSRTMRNKFPLFIKPSSLWHLVVEA